jgi:hypothetical protein
MSSQWGADNLPCCGIESALLVCPRLASPSNCAGASGHPVGDRLTRQLSLQPVAIGAVVEVTKRLKPSMEGVT